MSVECLAEKIRWTGVKINRNWHTNKSKPTSFLHTKAKTKQGLRLYVRRHQSVCLFIRRYPKWYVECSPSSFSGDIGHVRPCNSPDISTLCHLENKRKDISFDMHANTWTLKKLLKKQFCTCSLNSAFLNVTMIKQQDVMKVAKQTPWTEKSCVRAIQNFSFYILWVEKNRKMYLTDLMVLNEWWENFNFGGKIALICHKIKLFSHFLSC